LVLSKLEALGFKRNWGGGKSGSVDSTLRGTCAQEPLLQV
jgi:hypothetical protein